MLHQPAELAQIVEQFSHPRIMLIGDMMVDEYIYGNAERLSPEAPVPIIQERYRERRAGGAGNVATNLAVLGAEVLCVALRGADAQGELLISLLQKAGANTEGVLGFADRPTTSKIRLVGLAQHRHPQQMMRLDHEDSRPIEADQVEKLLAYVREHLPSCSLLCLEDYGKGLLTPSFTQEIIRIAKSLNKPVLVDPAAIGDYSKYRGATIITPNRTEAEKATGLQLKDSAEAAPALAAALLKQLELEACVLTLDRHGMYLLEGKKPGVLHATRPRTIYDVTGAGDMVLATMAMARACGATWSQAVDIANIAGGLEVEKFGCVPLKKEEILADLVALDAQGKGKERTLLQLVAELPRHRNSHRKIVFLHGCFNTLTAADVHLLSFAHQQGDIVIVSLAQTGETAFADRCTVLSALSFIDYLVPCKEESPLSLIQVIQPDVVVKTAEMERLDPDVVTQYGGRVVNAR